jgi:hypothetical protein
MNQLKLWMQWFLNSNSIGRYFINNKFKRKFGNSAGYWEKRYLENGNSGSGSYGVHATYKAAILNKFVSENKLQKIIEFGCGDGNQLMQFNFPSYIGLDVSETAIQKCRTIFKDDGTKSFYIYNTAELKHNQIFFDADATLSLDVIYHLVEDDVFAKYMYHLFAASAKYVIIYAWDLESNKSFHVRQRKFTTWINLNISHWVLKQKIENHDLEGACDFFIYEKI